MGTFLPLVQGNSRIFYLWEEWWPIQSRLSLWRRLAQLVFPPPGFRPKLPPLDREGRRAAPAFLFFRDGSLCWRATLVKERSMPMEERGEVGRALLRFKARKTRIAAEISE